MKKINNKIQKIENSIKDINDRLENVEDRLNEVEENISENRDELIIKLYKEGKKPKEISNLLNIKQTIVYNVIRIYKESKFDFYKTKHIKFELFGFKINFNLSIKK